MQLNSDFWEQRYQNSETGWDLGAVSPPLKAYFDSREDKRIRILIPGCGNAYEAEYLHTNGFADVTVIDLAPSAVERFKQRVPSFPKEKVILGDLFEHKGSYDLIVEQTFFCALDPSLRLAYSTAMARLLAQGGKVIGVMFNIPLNDDRPPFGGNEAEYRKLFGPLFTIETMEPCRNSVAPRMGNELWVSLLKA